VAQVPVNLAVAQPARLMLDAEAAATLPFRSCLPLGCFSELDMRDDVLLRRLRARAADQPGRVEWTLANGTQVALPVSLRGFTAAFEALGRS
jgi:invasion protein IalB